MTLDELEEVAHEAMMKEPNADIAFRRAVRAVLAEVKRAVPEELDLRGGVQAMSWNYCRDEMLRRLDEMSKDTNLVTIKGLGKQESKQ